MIFNQFEFLLLFLPAVLAVFFAPGLRWMRPYVLISASFVFYGYSGWEHAAVLTADILWVWFIVRTPSIVGNRIRLTAAVVPPFAALFYYKYLGFVASQLAGTDLLPTQEFSLFDQILLPAGISFFTFQIAAYAIDRYRGAITEPPPLRDMALYIGFFPQLVAGPILRFRDVAENLRNLRRFTPSSDDVARAVGYISIGLTLKVLIADTLNRYVSVVVTPIDTIDIVGVFFTTFAYSFQIFFDFYGYSLIAIGLGTVFGFRFPANFIRPYHSLNIREFWRRWHVTLSFWIRDYLYFPLGGNRNYARNILIVFTACGLWHGAGWNFLVWGLAHGGLVAGYHAGRRFWDRMPIILQGTGTFALVSILWLLFLFDFDELSRIFLAVWTHSPNLGGVPLDGWLVLVVAAAVCFGPRLEEIAENRLSSPVTHVLRNMVFGLFIVAVFVFLDRSQTFIYFRF